MLTVLRRFQRWIEFRIEKDAADEDRLYHCAHRDSGACDNNICRGDVASQRAM